MLGPEYDCPAIVAVYPKTAWTPITNEILDETGGVVGVVTVGVGVGLADVDVGAVVVGLVGELPPPPQAVKTTTLATNSFLISTSPGPRTRASRKRESAGDFVAGA